MIEKRPFNGRLAEAPEASEAFSPTPSMTRPAGDAPSASILQVVWRRRWIIVVCVIISLISGLIYLARAVPVYASNSKIYVQQGVIKVPGESQIAQNSANYLYTQCELIKSSAIVSSALQSPECAQAKSIRGMENPVGYLKYAINAQVGKQDDVISVSMESGSPDDAAVIVNSVVTAYIDYQNKLHHSSAAEVLKILQKEKEKQDDDYKALSAKMLKFQRDNGTLNFDGEKGNIVLQRLSQLSEVLTKAQIELLEAKVSLDTADALSSDPVRLKQFLAVERAKGNLPVSTAADAAISAQYQQQLAQYNLMKQTMGSDNPHMKTAERALNELSAHLEGMDQGEVDNYYGRLKEQYANAQRRESALRDAYNAQQKPALDLTAKAAEYAQMEDAAHRAEKLLDILDGEIKQINFSDDAESLNTFSILETAKSDPIPVRPNRSQTMGMALVIGLMVGLGGAMLQDWMDQRLRSAEEISSLLGLPVLSVIPHMLGKQSSAERGQEIVLHPKSDVAESYRTARTALYFGIPDAKSRTLLITSPTPGDGKSTMASNLAIATAQANRRVLLIDADCRKPMLHRIFALTQETGLSNVLLGRETPEKVIQRSSVENLDIMPCGPIPTNPSEVLNSQAFLDMINLLATKYDQIIIDSPPVVPVTDARILAASCDVTVLVLRADKSTRRMSEHARDALLSVGANVVGVVVNDVQRSRGGYGYYYSGYGYGYYSYGYGGKGEGSKGNGSSKTVKSLPSA